MRYYTETFGSPYSYRVLSDDKHGFEAEFYTDDDRHVGVYLSIDRGERLSTAEFRVGGQLGLTGGGDAFRILATVVKILGKFMDSNLDIETLSFDSVSGEYSRLSVYKKLIQRYAKDYHVHRDGTYQFRLERFA